MDLKSSESIAHYQKTKSLVFWLTTIYFWVDVVLFYDQMVFLNKETFKGLVWHILVNWSNDNWSFRVCYINKGLINLSEMMLKATDIYKRRRRLFGGTFGAICCYLFSKLKINVWLWGISCDNMWKICYKTVLAQNDETKTTHSMGMIPTFIWTQLWIWAIP